MKKFLLFILLFFLAYTLIKAIFRLFAPFNNNTSENQNNQKKGKNNITFDENNSSQKKHKKNDGEYVDFEEMS